MTMTEACPSVLGPARVFLAVLLAVLLAVFFGVGGQIGAVAQDFQRPLIPVTRDFILANGLRVVFSEDHAVPVVSLVIVYDVGARNEEKGRSGFAHLFEHMMFQGSDNVGKSEHFKYIESAGGSMNASTHSDFTDYFDKLPSNQVELALWLESDRMRSLKVTPENFENQLQTVKEEKRARIDNQPYTPAYLKLQETLFDNWANAHPTIGSFADLEASGVEDVRKFFKTYYAPNNAVMAIVGDFDAGKMQKLVERYFGTIPGEPAPGKPAVTEPLQTRAKYARVDDAHAKQPAFWVGWKVPPRRDPDYYALGVLEKIIASGESSRIYQRMVKGDKVALRADMWMDERRGPGAFEGFFVFKPGSTADKVREIMWSEIDKVKNGPVSQAEIDKAKNQILRGLFAAGGHSSLQRSLGRAEMLAEYTMFFGDPRYFDEDIEAYMKVTADDVRAVAKKYLTVDGIAVIDVVPVPARADASGETGRQAGTTAQN